MNRRWYDRELLVLFFCFLRASRGESTVSRELQAAHGQDVIERSELRAWPRLRAPLLVELCAYSYREAQRVPTPDIPAPKLVCIAKLTDKAL